MVSTEESVRAAINYLSDKGKDIPSFFVVDNYWDSLVFMERAKEYIRIQSEK